MSKTLVINLFAGPGTGKSSIMAGVFSQLKFAGVNCEMVTEYAKEQVWGDTTSKLNDQLYVFAKQNHRINILQEKVDVVITDSPILLSLIYGYKESDKFKDLVIEQHNRYNNLNIFLNREKKFNPKGRLQNEEKAKEIDSHIKKILDEMNIDHESYPGNIESNLLITNMILDKLKEI